VKAKYEIELSRLQKSFEQIVIIINSNTTILIRGEGIATKPYSETGPYQLLYHGRSPPCICSYSTSLHIPVFDAVTELQHRNRRLAEVLKNNRNGRNFRAKKRVFLYEHLIKLYNLLYLERTNGLLFPDGSFIAFLWIFACRWSFQNFIGNYNDQLSVFSRFIISSTGCRKNQNASYVYCRSHPFQPGQWLVIRGR